MIWLDLFFRSSYKIIQGKCSCYVSYDQGYTIMCCVFIQLVVKFPQNFPIFLQLAQNWIESIQSKELEAAGQSEAPPTLEDILVELRKCVSANYRYFEDKFTSLDYASIGVVSKEDFRDILDSVAFSLTDHQVGIERKIFMERKLKNCFTSQEGCSQEEVFSSVRSLTTCAPAPHEIAKSVKV